jgi:IS30 family transposase
MPSRAAAFGAFDEAALAVGRKFDVEDAIPASGEIAFHFRRAREDVVRCDAEAAFMRQMTALDEGAVKRRAQSRAACRKMHRPENREYVIAGLRKCWSPDQIAGRSQREFPSDPRRKLSHTTIYTWIKNDDHCRRWKKLLRCHKRKRCRERSQERVERAIEKRPAEINARERFGDWEGDTIVGSGPHGGVLISLVERKSRYLILLPLPNRKSEPVERSIRGRLQQLPPDMRRSITFDNGSEFAAYLALENSLGLKVYFTDPHSPWQRGTIEYHNRLVRQFAPKGTNLRDLSDYKVNDRPRKQLNYRPPAKSSKKPASLRFKLDSAKEQILTNVIIEY